MLQTTLHGGSVREIVLSSLRKAQISVWSAAHEICVVIVLSIVFPETYRAYFIAAPFTQSLEAATWTRIFDALLGRLCDINKGLAFQTRETPSTGELAVA
jgi:hypothetical protein